MMVCGGGRNDFGRNDFCRNNSKFHYLGPWLKKISKCHYLLGPWLKAPDRVFFYLIYLWNMKNNHIHAFPKQKCMLGSHIVRSSNCNNCTTSIQLTITCSLCYFYLCWMACHIEMQSLRSKHFNKITSISKGSIRYYSVLNFSI